MDKIEYLPENFASGLYCPVCDTPLHPKEYHGVEIDVCPQCRGVWLDRGEVVKLARVSIHQEELFSTNSAWEKSE